MTVYRAKRSGYVPRKVAREMWHSADIPQDIRRPWDVFHEDAVFRVHDRSGEFEDGHEDLRAVQKLGALRAFRKLPACRQREYTAISLQELSAFAAWSATSGLADAMERVAAWTGLENDLKAEHVPHNWRALLAEDPTWHVYIADDMKEEVEVHEEREGRDEEVAAEHNADKKNNSLLAAGVSPEAGTSTQAAVAARVRGVGKTSTAKARGVGRKSTQRAAGDKQNLHKPVCKRPARESNDPAATAQPALGEASGESPAAAVAGPFGSCRLTRRYGGSVERQSWLMVCDHPDHQTDGRCAKEYRVATAGSEDVAIRRLKTWIFWGRRESVMTRADHKKLWKDILKLDDDNGLPTMSTLDAAVSADGPVSTDGEHGRKPVLGRMEALEAKHPWGREGGPPPASEEELQSLAAGMIRLRKEAKNFSRPERANATTLALKERAEAMLHIMRNKARIGFGGGFAMASHGLSLNRSAGLAIAERTRKLADDLDALFDPESTPSVLIEEGITLLNAD